MDALRSKTVIIVEDEPLILMMMEDLAQQLGWDVDGCAGSEQDALDLLETCTPAVAVLDVNLGGDTSGRVARLCQSRGIRVVVTTGYATNELPAEFDGAAILAKPFSNEEFDRALREVLAVAGQ